MRPFATCAAQPCSGWQFLTFAKRVGKHVPSSSFFCPYCGAAIPRPELAESTYTWSDSSAPATGRYRESDGCPSCGRTISPAAQVCPYCGVDVEAFIASLRQQTLHKLDQYEQAEQEQRQQERERLERQKANAQQSGP
jgi:predicted RNA-binding Zn-ribbon protein involved in translation (DUF1610 family)